MIATSEYELLTESVGAVDRSERAKFLVRGGEAVEFLQGQVSNDVEALAPGSGCYATILSHKGKLRTDLRILRGEDFLLLDTEAIGHAVVQHLLQTYALGRDVDAEYERLKPVVGDWVQEPTTMPWGNRSLLFRDPDGNLVNFFTPVTEAAIEKFTA